MTRTKKSEGVQTDLYTYEVQHSPWKMVVGRLLSYWEGNFLEAMFNFGEDINP